jgi:hypothetical protein
MIRHAAGGEAFCLRLIGCSMCSIDGLTLLSIELHAKKKTREFCAADRSQAKLFDTF